MTLPNQILVAGVCWMLTPDIRTAPPDWAVSPTSCPARVTTGTTSASVFDMFGALFLRWVLAEFDDVLELTQPFHLDGYHIPVGQIARRVRRHPYPARW